MQQQMSFLETPAPQGAAPVWAALDEAQRAEGVAVLARVMARMAAPRRAVAGTDDPETGDE